jgi:coenzyme F420 hydrogenase subunit beta
VRAGGSKTVQTVLDGNLCSGCGLCAALTRSPMTVEAPGFNRPHLHAAVSPETEAAIAQSCPGSVVAPWSMAPDSHEYWGPYLGLHTGHAADPNLRHRASSGGALSALLLHALEHGLVDAVVEVASDPSRPTANLISIASTPSDILNGAGSRYAPSSPLQGLIELLERNDRLAFVGKPCDVSALRLFASHDPRVTHRFPLMLSFFCAGVPSLERSDAIVRKMGLEPTAVRSFRYRGEGWPGEAAAVATDGTERRMSYADSWGGILSKEIQFRCKICPDAVGGSADLVCADAWYADESGYPVFDDLPGRSLVIPRTAAGADLLRGAVSSGALILDDKAVSPGEIDRMQPGQTRKKRLVASRTAALRLLLRPVPAMKNLAVRKASARAPFREKAKNFLGTIRRIVTGKM